MSESFTLTEHEFEVGDHQCSFCNKSYKSAKSLRSHVKCHTGEGYQCKFCLMFYAAPSTLQRHMKTHIEQPSCRCHVCDREFVAPKNLKWHIRAVHGGDVNVLMKSLGDEYRSVDLTPSFKCEFCDKPYAHSKSLRKHMISVHGYEADQIVATPSTTKSDGVNPSPSDSFVFYSDSNARTSENEETSADVLYSCELCPENQLFSTLESVVAHMQIHQTDSDTTSTQTSVNQFSQESESADTSSPAPREDETVVEVLQSLESSELTDVTHAELPQLVHTSDASIAEQLVHRSPDASIASVEQIEEDNSQNSTSIASSNHGDAFVSLIEQDEGSDYSEGYEESDNVVMGQIGSVEDETICIKQEILESDTSDMLPTEQLHKDVHHLHEESSGLANTYSTLHKDVHHLHEESSGLANTYSMLGYEKNLKVLDVQEFQCTDENSVCSVKVLEVDAKDLTEQGFIDVFVINNEKTLPGVSGEAEDSQSIDNVFNAIVKHETLESSSLHNGDESSMLILENEDASLGSHVTTKKDDNSKSCRCTTCGRCFESREILYYHKKTVHIKSNNRFKCQLCRNTYQTWSYLKKHQQRVHYDREKARFKCSFCTEAFPQRHMLVMHVKKHTGQKDHVCNVCNKRFAELFVLNAHRKLVHFPEKLFECAECQKKYKSFAGLKKHIVSHSGQKNHVCHCGKAFSTPESLQNHEKLHSDEKPFACPHCSKCFVMKAILKKHVKRVHENVKTVDITKKPYVCDCGKRFAFETYLTNHIACYHSDFKPHQCSVCSKPFSKRYMLNKHVKREHPGTISKTDSVPKQTFPCTECDKRFTSLYHYKKHCKKMHPDEVACSEVESEKPSTFVCHCGKEFSQERYLKCHLIVHDKIKPFACNSCDKSFSKLFKLNRHMKFVHMKKAKPVDMNKQFVCDCGKRFSNKRNLACHKITHKPRDDFKCPVCGKHFGANYLLNKHLRRVHEEDPNDYIDLSK